MRDSALSAKPAMYLISGWGFHARVLDRLAAALRSRRSVTVLGLPGYGLLPSVALPAADDIDSLAEPLLPLVHCHSILAGWSLGGMVAIRIAAMLQNKVRGLALLSSTPCFVRKKGWPWGVNPDTIKDMAARLPHARDKVLREFAWLVARGDVSPRQSARKLIGLANECPATIDSLLGGLQVLKETDLREDLAKLRCPVTMVMGEHDSLVPAEAGSALKALRPGLQFCCIRGVGHAPFISRCSQTARLLGGVFRDYQDETV